MAARPLIALTAILFIGISLAACQPQRAARQPCPAGKLCLEYGNGSDPNTLNPQLATATNEAAILREVFEGMFTDADDGSPTPGVAQSSETSPDGLVWTFRLRPERWSDGQPVTAGDFVYAYQRILDPKTASSYAYLLYVLKNAQAVNSGKMPVDAVGARALDDHTLQLTLEHPASYLPQLLKHQSFFPIPAHSVRILGDHWADPGKMVSNGAYTLAEWRLGDYVRIEKNPFFRNADKVCLDRVDFYPTTDTVTAERRVFRGELDINAGIESDRVGFLRSKPETAQFVRSHSYLATYYVIFNQRDVAALKDVRVRQALSMAIDRRFITDKLLRAGQVPTTAFVPPMIAGYVPAGAPRPAPYWAAWPLDRRQSEAHRLLAAAGFGPARPLKLQAKTSNSRQAVLVIQSIQADWKAIGVETTLRQEDGIVSFQSFEIRDFQVGTIAWVADFDDPLTFLGLMKSDTGAQNYGDYRNTVYDALLNRADNEPEATVRAGYLAKAEQLMLNDADVAPMYNGVNLNLVSPLITGWRDNDSDIHPIRDLCRSDAGRPKPRP